MSELKISLKAARVNAKLTVKAAAKKLSIAPSTLISWEKNPEKISAIRQDEIAKAYNISVDNIIFLPRD